MITIIISRVKIGFLGILYGLETRTLPAAWILEESFWEKSHYLMWTNTLGLIENKTKQIQKDKLNFKKQERAFPSRCPSIHFSKTLFLWIRNYSVLEENWGRVESVPAVNFFSQLQAWSTIGETLYTFSLWIIINIALLFYFIECFPWIRLCSKCYVYCFF